MTEDLQNHLPDLVEKRLKTEDEGDKNKKKWKEQKAIKKMKEDKNESRWDKPFEYSDRWDEMTLACRPVPLPYEPTPYSVLERLANAGYIRKGNIPLDYGCGKGKSRLLPVISDKM